MDQGLSRGLGYALVKDILTIVQFEGEFLEKSIFSIIKT